MRSNPSDVGSHDTRHGRHGTLPVKCYCLKHTMTWHTYHTCGHPCHGVVCFRPQDTMPQVIGSDPNAIRVVCHRDSI